MPIFAYRCNVVALPVWRDSFGGLGLDRDGGGGRDGGCNPFLGSRRMIEDRVFGELRRSWGLLRGEEGGGT